MTTTMLTHQEIQDFMENPIKPPDQFMTHQERLEWIAPFVMEADCGNLWKTILEYKAIAEERDRKEKTELAISKKNNILCGRGLFAENPIFNYYNIRNKNYQWYYDDAKANGESRASVRRFLPKSAGGGDRFRNVMLDIGCEEISVKSFYNTLVEKTGYDEFTPYKSWLNMKIPAFVEYFLDKLDFYHCSAKKKRFFNLLINYYYVKWLERRADVNQWVQVTDGTIIYRLAPYCEEWCNVDDPRKKTKFLGFVSNRQHLCF
jgi:hypothetical protein